MSLTLTVDGERWRHHLRGTAERHPGLVPVAKGNGYGFTLARLARRAQWLSEQGLHPTTADTVAVGTYAELPHVADRYAGSLLVLTPWRPFGPAVEATGDAKLVRRLVHTVSREQDLHDLLERRPDARFVLERATSMQRHGLAARELWSAAAALRGRGARLEGVALHLPLGQGRHVGEVDRLLTDVVGAGLPDGPGARTVWVSHLSEAELAELGHRWPDFTFRPRTGTGLWLGDRGALRPHATVLDVHPLERGDSFGYRGRTAPKSGHLLVVSGGTAHGIGLEAPTGDLGLRGRAGTLARGGLDALGFVRSPYSVDGSQRLFAEPPHMQASMLFVPSGARVPAVGEEIDVRVRYTATTFDRVEVS